MKPVLDATGCGVPWFGVAHEPPPDVAELSKPPDPVTEADSRGPGLSAADPSAPPVWGSGLQVLRVEGLRFRV